MILIRADTSEDNAAALVVLGVCFICQYLPTVYRAMYGQLLGKDVYLMKPIVESLYNVLPFLVIDSVSSGVYDGHSKLFHIRKREYCIVHLLRHISIETEEGSHSPYTGGETLNCFLGCIATQP